MINGLFFSNASTHNYITSNWGHKLFSKKFSEKLINNLEFDQVRSTSPFMDVIKDVCRSILLKRCEKIGASFVAN